MKKIIVSSLILIITLSLGLLSFKQNDPFHDQLKTYVDQHLNELLAITSNILEANKKDNVLELQASFYRARIPYKRTEALIEYFYTESATKLNGPNLLEADVSMPGEYKYPTGFQVLEEALFAEEYDQHKVRNEIENLQYHLHRVKAFQHDVIYTQSNVLDALKMNLFRLLTKGITGFDSPVIFNSVAEAKETLHGTQLILELIGETKEISNKINSAINYLNTVEDFDTWDRAVFITQYMNPTTAALVNFQRNASIPFDTLMPKLIHPEALTLFDFSKWDIMFFAPADALPINNRNVKLGEQLFFDNRLSVNLQRNCGTCHDPKRDFTDGLKTNTTLLGKDKILRNSPTMINAAWQPHQFYDRRVVYLEDQIHDVVTNDLEMGQDFSILVDRLNKDKDLKQKFKEAIGSQIITERDIKRLVATYIRSLTKFETPFDKYMNGDHSAMGSAAINGFNLFMGKAKCGTCHFMPLFNGTVPPNFDKIESEVLGVPVAKDIHEVDKDLGAFNIYKIGYQKYSFKTPSVRTTNKTAPYMHNGVYETLDDVIDFYNHGGGAAIGIDLEFQTLPPDSLHLSPQEKLDIKAFLQAL